MIVVFHRSNLCILAISVLLSAMTLNLALRAPITPAGALPADGKVVVIDAGHGASDGGAVGISGTQEKDINLKVASLLSGFLEQSGTVVLPTRTDDSPIAPTKKEDMHLRRKYRDERGADIFVSIHMNKFSQQQYSGAQVFYADDEKSRILGECIQTEMKSLLNPSNNRAAKKTDGSVFLLKNNSVPSVIVECGFLSNPHEEQLLNTADYQEKVARAICSGIIKYFDTEYSTNEERE